MTARLEFKNQIRDLPPALVRIAVLIVAIGPGPKAGRRSDADTSVSGSEGASCLIPTRDDHSHG
jgi:hypothetical protein